MIQITPQMHILLAVKPVDFRKGIDSLVNICRTHLESDPFTGTLFIFRNKRQTSIKIIVYDGQGFWLCQKRFSKGKIKSWPTSNIQNKLRLKAHELQLLLWNGDIEKLNSISLWKPL